MNNGKKLVMRVLPLILIIVLVFSLTACNNSKQPEPTSTGTEEVKSISNDVGYPNKQISLVIQAGPGGESDLTGRIIGQAIEEQFGVPVVSSNVTGASGAVAFQHVKSQDSDGYTIGICPAEIAMVDSLGLASIAPDDLDFLGGAAETPSSVIVRADAPYDTLEEFVEYAKNNSVVSGTSGAGSTLHVASALLERAAGVEFRYVPYDGSAPAITALMGGHVDVVTIGVLSASAGVQSGDLKILAILGEDRVPQYPEVPTAIEAGVDCAYSTWVGLYAPAGLAPDIKDQLEEAIKVGVNGDAYKSFAEERGLQVKYRNSKEFTEFVNENYKMYSELIPTLDLN